MNKTRNKVIGLVAITAILVLLASSSFFLRHEEKYRTQYDTERLKNDSLMGAVQTLQKQLQEKEQELLANNSLLDSLRQVCVNSYAGSDAIQ